MASEGSKIETGDIITDGIVRGKVLERGSIRMGRRDVPGYRVEILGGHQAGATSFIMEDDAVRVAGTEGPSPGVDKPVIMTSGGHENVGDDAGRADGPPHKTVDEAPRQHGRDRH